LVACREKQIPRLGSEWQPENLVHFVADPFSLLANGNDFGHFGIAAAFARAVAASRRGEEAQG